MILTRTDTDTFNIEEEVHRRINAKSLDTLLLIVPTNRKMRYLKKELISKSPGGNCGRLYLDTIGTFSSKLFFEMNSPKEKVLSDAAAAVLVRQSFRETKLSYFSNYKDDVPFGTLQRVKNVISQYKRHGITPQLIIEEAQKLEGGERLKALDIAGIYSNYKLKCEQIGVNEIGDVYEGLNSLSVEEFNARFKKLYADAELIVINGFDEFTSPEIEIIYRASEILPLFISFDYYRENTLLFAHLDQCYKKLKARGFKIIEDTSPDVKDGFKKTIKEKLFVSTDANKKDLAGSITLLSASTRYQEVEIIAKEIKELILHEKVEPHNICIVFNLIHNYSPIIRDVFPVYGIPFNLTDRFKLSTSQPVISILNYLEIIENDFYYKNIFRALSGNYIRFDDIDLSNLIQAAVELKIISGFNNWQNTLHDAIHNISENDNGDTNSLKAASYKKALKDINRIYEKLKSFDKQMSLSEFSENLNKLIYSSGLPLNLLNEPYGEPEKNVKALTTFSEIVSEMLDIFALEYGKDKKFPLKFFLNNMRTAVASSRFNIKEKPDFGVQVTTLNEIRGISFDVLFIGGLIDGDLPLRYAPEIFFSGEYLVKENIHQTEQRYLFYQALSGMKKKLYLSFPLREEKRELVQSNFVNALLNLIKAAEKSESDYTDIYSRDELLKITGTVGVENITAKFHDIFTDNEIAQINHCVEIDKLRSDLPWAESPFTGHLTEDISDSAREKLNSLKDELYSVSQLEKYAQCPYKYLAENILKLNVREEPTEEFETIEMGTLLHNILYSFYKKMKEEKIILPGCSDEQFQFAFKCLFEIAELRINEVNLKSPLSFLEKEKILGINGKPENSIIYRFLVTERENADGFVPKYFETGFGRIKDEEGRYSDFLENFKAGGVDVRGKIDRIDINESTGSFKVIDYKSGGKKPAKEELESGISLQLPLYLFAAKELIKAQMQKEFNPFLAEIYSLKFNSKDFGRKPVTTLSLRGRKKISEYSEQLTEDNLRLIEKCCAAIKGYVENITAGKFNLTTLKNPDEVCRHCSFRTICRIDEAN